MLAIVTGQLTAQRFGLDRLLVGTSMRGDGRTTFRGVLPYDEIEGSTAALLGKLMMGSEGASPQARGQGFSAPLEARQTWSA